jgi:NAD(P)H-dependent nitrite reductase small subunit
MTLVEPQSVRPARPDEPAGTTQARTAEVRAGASGDGGAAGRSALGVDARTGVGPVPSPDSGYVAVCPLGNLVPDRGVAAWVDDRAVAVFLLSGLGAYGHTGRHPAAAEHGEVCEPVTHDEVCAPLEGAAPRRSEHVEGTGSRRGEPDGHGTPTGPWVGHGRRPGAPAELPQPAGALFALDNVDPFSGASVLSRGLVGDAEGTATVASPMYKQRFDLRTGRCLDDASVSVATHDVVVASGWVCVRLGGPPGAGPR